MLRYGDGRLAILIGMDTVDKTSRWILCAHSTEERAEWTESFQDTGPVSPKTPGESVTEGQAVAVDGGFIVSIAATPGVAAIRLPSGGVRPVEAHEGGELLIFLPDSDLPAELVGLSSEGSTIASALIRGDDEQEEGGAPGVIWTVGVDPKPDS